MINSTECHFCCHLEQATFKHSNVVVVGTIEKVFLVASLCALIYFLNFSYRNSYQRSRRPHELLKLKRADASPALSVAEHVKTEAEMLPNYYTYSQLACLYFIAEYLSTIPHATPTVQAIRAILFGLGSFFDNFVIVYLWTPQPMSGARAVGITLGISVVFWGFATLGPGSRRCAWCDGVHIPRDTIWMAYIPMVSTYMFCCAFYKSKVAGWSPRPAIFAWSLMLSLTYGFATVGSLLLDRLDSDAGYCLVTIGVLTYSLSYAPLLFYVFVKDTKYLADQETKELMRHMRLPLLTSDNEDEESNVGGLDSRAQQQIHELLSDTSISLVPRADLHLLRKIGVGGYGAVYLARWGATTVAVKQLTAIQSHNLLSQRPMVLPADSETSAGGASGVGTGAMSGSTPSVSRAAGGNGEKGIGGGGGGGGRESKRTFSDDRSGTAGHRRASTESGAGQQGPSPVLLDFLYEARVLSTLRHPNVLMLLGVCIDPGYEGIITEYLPRGSLYDILHKSDAFRHNPGPLPPYKKLSIIRQVASGMTYLHSRSIIHRDLKSANVLLDAYDDAKVCDFGLARALGNNNTMTAVGTAQWAAPEVLRHDRYSSKADVWGFGVVLWELLSECVPFDGMGTVRVAAAVGFQALTLHLPDDVDAGEDIVKVLNSCWEQEPEDRPSFVELEEQLAKLDAGKSFPVLPPRPKPCLHSPTPSEPVK